MRRREFIRLIGGAAAAWPIAARAQQSKDIPTVGVLWHAGSAEEEDVYLSVLVKAFNDLGYVEGKNIRLDHRFPAENPDRFRTLGQELIDAKPDAIVAVTVAGAVALKHLTSTIPIVFVLVPDPISAPAAWQYSRPVIRNVRFTPKSGHREAPLRCPLCANNGHGTAHSIN
jgi:putative ABC transport system substrate-binding protein